MRNGTVILSQWMYNSMEESSRESLIEEPPSLPDPPPDPKWTPQMYNYTAQTNDLTRDSRNVNIDERIDERPPNRVAYSERPSIGVPKVPSTDASLSATSQMIVTAILSPLAPECNEMVESTRESSIKSSPSVYVSNDHSNVHLQNNPMHLKLLHDDADARNGESRHKPSHISLPLPVTSSCGSLQSSSVPSGHIRDSTITMRPSMGLSQISPPSVIRHEMSRKMVPPQPMSHRWPQTAAPGAVQYESTLRPVPRPESGVFRTPLQPMKRTIATPVIQHAPKLQRFIEGPYIDANGQRPLTRPFTRPLTGPLTGPLTRPMTGQSAPQFDPKSPSVQYSERCSYRNYPPIDPRMTSMGMGYPQNYSYYQRLPQKHYPPLHGHIQNPRFEYPSPMIPERRVVMMSPTVASMRDYRGHLPYSSSRPSQGPNHSLTEEPLSHHLRGYPSHYPSSNGTKMSQFSNNRMIHEYSHMNQNIQNMRSFQEPYFPHESRDFSHSLPASTPMRCSTEVSHSRQKIIIEPKTDDLREKLKMTHQQQYHVPTQCSLPLPMQQPDDELKTIVEHVKRADVSGSYRQKEEFLMQFFNGCALRSDDGTGFSAQKSIPEPISNNKQRTTESNATDCNESTAILERLLRSTDGHNRNSPVNDCQFSSMKQFSMPFDSRIQNANHYPKRFNEHSESYKVQYYENFSNNNKPPPLCSLPLPVIKSPSLPKTPHKDILTEAMEEVQLFIVNDESDAKELSIDENMNVCIEVISSDDTPVNGNQINAQTTESEGQIYYIINGDDDVTEISAEELNKLIDSNGEFIGVDAAAESSDRNTYVIVEDGDTHEDINKVDNSDVSTSISNESNNNKIESDSKETDEIVMSLLSLQEINEKPIQQTVTNDVNLKTSDEININLNTDDCDKTQVAHENSIEMDNDIHDKTESIMKVNEESDESLNSINNSNDKVFDKNNNDNSSVIIMEISDEIHKKTEENTDSDLKNEEKTNETERESFVSEQSINESKDYDANENHNDNESVSCVQYVSMPTFCYDEKSHENDHSLDTNSETLLIENEQNVPVESNDTIDQTIVGDDQLFVNDTEIENVVNQDNDDESNIKCDDSQIINSVKDDELTMKDAVENAEISIDAVESEEPMNGVVENQIDNDVHSEKPMNDAVDTKETINNGVECEETMNDVVENEETINNDVECEETMNDVVENEETISNDVECEETMNDAVENEETINNDVECEDTMNDAVEIDKTIKDGIESEKILKHLVENELKLNDNVETGDALNDTIENDELQHPIVSSSEDFLPNSTLSEYSTNVEIVKEVTDCNNDKSSALLIEDKDNSQQLKNCDGQLTNGNAPIVIINDNSKKTDDDSALIIRESDNGIDRECQRHYKKKKKKKEKNHYRDHHHHGDGDNDNHYSHEKYFRKIKKKLKKDKKRMKRKRSLSSPSEHTSVSDTHDDSNHLTMTDHYQTLYISTDTREASQPSDCITQLPSSVTPKDVSSDITQNIPSKTYSSLMITQRPSANFPDEELIELMNKLRKNPTGFELGWTPIEIVGINQWFDMIIFAIKWENNQETLVPAESANRHIPQMVIEFYEKHIGWDEDET